MKGAWALNTIVPHMIKAGGAVTLGMITCSESGQGGGTRGKARYKEW